MRLILAIIALAFFIGLAYHVFAATNPDTETPSIRPETSTRAKREIVRCIPPRILIVAQRLPDGTRKPIATLFVPGTCN